MDKLARYRKWVTAWAGGLVVGLGWLWASGAMAQVARPAGVRVPSGRVGGVELARVYAVPASGQAVGFKVPQVQLTDGAVARRINRQLLQLTVGGEGDVDSMATAVRQLQQAARACCYDADTRQWQGAHGLTGCDYSVLLNRGGLLSLKISLEFTGAYSWTKTEHHTFNLRTGRRLTLAEVVADAPAQLHQRMRRAVSLRLGEALAETQQDYEGDTATINHVAEQFGWNWATHQTTVGEEADLSEFALTPQKLLLFYRVGFAHVETNFEPDDTYRFAYSSLQLQPLVRKAIGLPPAPAKNR